MSLKKYSIKKIFLHFFICSIIGLLISFFSFSEINFWNKVLEMITNRWFVVTLLVAISVLVNDVYNLYCNKNIMLRHTSLQILIKKAISDISFLIFVYMLIIFLILSILAIIYCEGNFEVVNFSYYSMPLYIYNIFFYIRLIVFLILIGIIEFILKWKTNGVVTSIFTTMLIILMLFGFDFVISSNIITKFSEFPIFITSYFEVKPYFSFKLELVASFIQFLFWIFLIIIGYKNFFVKQQKDRMK